MGIRTSRTHRCARPITLTMLLLAGCSGSRKVNVSQDAAPDATPDCVEMQRDYVNARLAPDQQTDVATTVHAVLGAADFPGSMPYCSGDRPGGD